MKEVTVIAAGLGAKLLERNHLTKFAGLSFDARPSVFPAVTCVAQATLRTGLAPAEHGMIANGVWSEELRKPLFWEQHAALIKGRRVWANRRAAGGKVGLYFLQQSLGEEADTIVSPAPIHKHGGGMIFSTYTKPTGMAEVLEELYGSFPLWRYWGPLASPRVGQACLNFFEGMTQAHDVDEAYLYLPTLDYAAQKNGPDSHAAYVALKEFRRQLERLADLCQKRGAKLKVIGDYEIHAVTAEPMQPNMLLRQAGLFKVREIKGMAYPDFYQSTAFAMCDHECCVVCGEKKDEAKRLLLEAGMIETSLPEVLLAPAGSWCAYEWWKDKREAPDFAAHVDIHNKPGYDPKELFFFNRGRIRGTHGRECEVAYGE